MSDLSRPGDLLTALALAIVVLGVHCGPSAERQEPRREGPGEATAAEGERTPGPDPASLLPNGREPFAGILAGGQPGPDQLRELRDLGYRAIVNLRVAGEEGSTRREEVEALGMAYFALPIAGPADVNADNARRLAAILAEAGTPVVVHCASGNRVGALFALKAFLVDGKPAEEALEIGKAAGLTRLESDVRRQIGPADQAP